MDREAGVGCCGTWDVDIQGEKARRVADQIGLGHWHCGMLLRAKSLCRVIAGSQAAAKCT